MSTEEKSRPRPPKWCLGILNDPETDEVPGSILLMPKGVEFNQPLGLREAPPRTSASTLPSPYLPGYAGSNRSRSRSPHAAASVHSFRFNVQPPLEEIQEEKKKSPRGFILEPQPDDSLNDPLNWHQWRRDLALISLGFFCMIGGGMTPVLAAGYNQVAADYGVPVAKVSLTTGIYMLGLGVGNVIVSPTAILFGKRPIYLIGCILFIITSIWCAVSPNYVSLVVARVFMGISVSPVEALPSATIAEIFFLHERAYRLGIYTLLLLGGKNLDPLVSAAIINALSWRWVFWIFAICGAFAGVLLFLFVPETFWDRTPRPRTKLHHLSKSVLSVVSHVSRMLTPGGPHNKEHQEALATHDEAALTNRQKLTISSMASGSAPSKGTIAQRRQQKNQQHVEFSDDPMARIHLDRTATSTNVKAPQDSAEIYGANTPKTGNPMNALNAALGEEEQTTSDDDTLPGEIEAPRKPPRPVRLQSIHRDSWRVQPKGQAPNSPEWPELHHFNSPSYDQQPNNSIDNRLNDVESQRNVPSAARTPHPVEGDHAVPPQTANDNYTHQMRQSPPRSFKETLKPWNGRLRKDKWLKAAVRPFILYAYPAILWSALVYSLSVGWLIVLSESVSVVYQNKETYNFTSLQVGLIYISPFIGAILGTVVAGKVSDVIVRFMSRKNDGVYEPEFRLVMTIPVAISTCVGLMGFGWSAQVYDAWIVPTILFAVISFGCSLGSTTAITFAVDSYRVYAGEALVTLNFSKNVYHGFVFSLFFTGWLESSGPRTVFLVVGGIQLGLLLTTIPMYIFGKRLRMWTVRKKMMEKW